MIILSDIHANLSALISVLEDIKARYPNEKSMALLGDCVNYGMRPNEVIETLESLTSGYDIICNIFGNHEKALLDGDTVHFSTERGRQILEYTRGIVLERHREYIKSMAPEGCCERYIDEKRCLFIHGDINDHYWGKLNSLTINDNRYKPYEYVFSGHSHIPHLMECFYDDQNKVYRNKKRTVFVNPGSVGQPRNHNPRAQYAYVDLRNEIFHFNSVEYDIEAERSLYNESVDSFYRDRLIKGI